MNTLVYYPAAIACSKCQGYRYYYDLDTRTVSGCRDCWGAGIDPIPMVELEQ
jgi:hypothetical protein